MALLQGVVKFHTGGDAAHVPTSPRTGPLPCRTGWIPVPTVIVRMEEAVRVYALFALPLLAGFFFMRSSSPMDWIDRRL